LDILAILNRIEALLKAQGRTKTQLYTACGITASAVSQWKSGRTTPYPKTLQRIADYLDVSYEYLTTGLGEMKKKPTLEGRRSPDPDIRRIERARANMSEKDKKKMMELLRLSFEDYFSDDYEDDDVDE